MATGKTIEAILRLAADVAPALAGMRQLRKEAEATQQGSQGSNAGTAAREATQAEQARSAATREERRKRRAEERAADAEALAAQRAQARAQRELDAQQRRERRAADEEERRRQRKERADKEREDLRASSAAQRAERDQARKLGQVAPQVTDIVTGLAGGQNPLLVALQQGGQLRDIFGSARGAAQALLSVFTPMRVAIGGIVGGAALLVTQIIAGHRESEQLRRTLALTGNAAGTSLGQINGLAQGIAAEVNVSIGLARDALGALLTVQGQTQGTLGATGKAVVAIAKLTGQSAEEVVKNFDDQAKGITDWATKANKAYNFLTPAQLAYIRTLEQQGRVSEAIRTVNNELAQTLAQRTAPALGTLERGWNAVKVRVGELLDALKELGRDNTAEERIAQLQRTIEGLQNVRANKGVATFGQILDPRSFEQQEADAQGELQGLNRDAARRQELAIQAQERDREIAQQSIENQQSLTAVTLAEATKRTAGILADLDRRQTAVELADARGLVSERDKALALNRIDQERLRAQLALQQAQRDEAARLVQFEKNEQAVRQAQARVTEAEAQITATRSRLTAAIGEAQRITDADALAKARERAKAWADVWAKAADQVRGLERDNALTAAGRLSDPQERASVQARLSTQDLQRQVDDTARELRVQIALAISPESRDALREQLGALLLESSAAIQEVARRAQVDSVRSQVGEQLEALRLQEERLNAEVERGALTTEQAEARKFAAREEALPQLRKLLELLQGLARTDGEKNAVAGLLLQLDQISDKTTELQRTMRGAAQSGLASMFTDIETGAERADRALGKMVLNFAQRMLDVLNQRLAEKLVKGALDALDSFKASSGGDSGAGGGGGWLSALSTWIASLFHTGGVVGQTAGATRAVAPWVFHGAQVLHSGGIAGLMPDETPAILRKGEEVLTEQDPRHRKNVRSGSPVIGNLNISVSMDGAGDGDAELARRLAGALNAAVEAKLADELRPGGMLYGRA